MRRRLPAMILATGLLTVAAGCNEAPRDEKAGTEPAVAPAFANEPSTVTPDIPKPGSVVLVMVDALRPDELGAYGSEDNLTPNLDALAEQSVVFENATATSSWTRSSVGSMFTGRYPVSHTVLDKDDLMPERALTLAEVLEAHGDFWSYGITTNPNTSDDIGFDQGFDHYRRPREVERRQYEGDRFGLIPAAEVTRVALDLWDDERRGKDQSTLGFVHYMDPHDPYMENHELMGEAEPEGRFGGAKKELKELRDLPDDQRTDADEARVRYLYRGEVRYADQGIGGLIEGFRERGVFDDMLLMVTSDHGESFWEHGKRGHGQTLYQTLLHLPLMIKLPGMQPGDGNRVSQPVSLVDLAPTVVDAMGIPRPTEFEGRSLLPLVKGEQREPWLDYIYAENYLIERYTKTAIRHGDFKLIATYNRDDNGEYESTELELYDLSNDPGEQSDLSDDPARRATLNRMVGALVTWEDAVARRSLGASTGSLEDLRPETLEELRGLGYIE